MHRDGQVDPAAQLAHAGGIDRLNAFMSGTQSARSEFTQRIVDKTGKVAFVQVQEKTPEDIWAEDAATSVRSSAPLKLPTRAPASDEDEYKNAWNDM